MFVSTINSINSTIKKDTFRKLIKLINYNKKNMGNIKIDLKIFNNLKNKFQKDTSYFSVYM